MFQRKPKRFIGRSNGRRHSPHRNGSSQNRMHSNSFSNGHNRNNYRPTLSAEKLLEKYSTLAKEAMTSGDKTLSENYLQHADHYMRVIEEKNKNQLQNKNLNAENLQTEEKDPPIKSESAKEEKDPPIKSESAKEEKKL